MSQCASVLAAQDVIGRWRTAQSRTSILSHSNLTLRRHLRMRIFLEHNFREHRLLRDILPRTVNSRQRDETLRLGEEVGSEVAERRG